MCKLEGSSACRTEQADRATESDDGEVGGAWYDDEEEGSSRVDHSKKRLYRQRLREFDRRHADACDTALSSSNVTSAGRSGRI